MRARATIAGALIVSVALTLGAVLFVILLDRALVDAAAATAESQAETIADDVESRGAAAVPDDDDDVVVQLTRDGDVLATSSEEVRDALPVTDDPVRASVDGEPSVVVSAETELDGRDAFVVVARPIDEVAEAVSVAGGLLVVAVPLVTGVVALLLWLVVARALRPVDRIRRDVDAIEAASLDRRIDPPGTGDEIARLADTMNRLLDRIDVAQRSQRRFVSDASHELRSPVATLRQYADLARSHPDSVSPAEFAQVVGIESTRMAELVDTLLLLAKADEGRAATRVEVDLDDLLLAEATRLRGLGVTVDSSGVGPARVLADAVLLGRAVRNLADNAARHAVSAVALGSSVQDRTAVLTIDDDGAGIPPADRVRVFDRFVRLDEARSRDAGGAGLGLAIVAEAAALHGGTAEVTGSPTGGARVELRLPAAPPDPLG